MIWDHRHHKYTIWRKIGPLSVSSSEMLEEIQVKNLILTFPNVYVALKIFVLFPISNASGESSFSVVKRVKSFFRTLMAQEKLTNFAIIAQSNQKSQKWCPQMILRRNLLLQNQEGKNF